MSETRTSFISNCPPQAYKFFMEQHIERVWREHEKRKVRRQELMKALQELKNYHQIPFSQESFQKKMEQIESQHLRMRRAKLTIKDFNIIKRIGTGCFGGVDLVKKKGMEHQSILGRDSRPTLFAMKTINKDLVLKRKQVAHVRTEMAILSKANDEWIVKLHYSCQVIKNKQMSLPFQRTPIS